MDHRLYGNAPFRVAVIHGGPGAPGYMAPVARELSKNRGILEPLQTRDSLDGQIEELAGQLAEYAEPPATLIGSSWGAVLALFVATRSPHQVRKLILVGSAVFDAHHSSLIEARRLGRLDDRRRSRLGIVQAELDKAKPERRNQLFAEMGDILSSCDMFDPISNDLEVLAVQPDLHEKVWSDFKALRDEPGRLRQDFSRIGCPAVVIHGDYDPHPIEGIRPFLESCLPVVRFHILDDCGHYPWLERQARSKFYQVVDGEL